jgi:nitrile hydratase accessory protein
LADPDRGFAFETSGPAAPPRRNGELVFEAPWESRLFGITLALLRAGRFEWEEFRRLLIAEIGRWERASRGSPEAEFRYYERWHAALEQLVEQKGLCPGREIEARARVLATRPPGHDH